jgi:predicted Zn-dependent protease
MLYAEALVADEQFEAAEKVLLRQSIVNKHDVDVWYDLAEVSGLAGNIVGVHLARAEFFTLHGAYQRAIQHLEYARRLTSRKNEQLHARLDQRITDLRDKLREARS